MQKLAVNAGFTCPNRDGRVGTGGCTFCNNEAFTPSYCQPFKSVARQIEEGIEFHRNRYRRAERYLVYFQSFSNTYAPLERLRAVYGEALANPLVAGVVVGTRPDCVDDAVLDYFAELARTCYVAVEYGIESCYDETLRAVNRGHDFDCARRAVEATAARGIHVGAHFILGLPGETDGMMTAQTETINALPLTTVKFHQLQIFRDTPMEADWKAHPERYRFRTLDEYMELFIGILRRGTFRRRGSAAVPLRADLGPYPQRTVDGHARKTSARNGRLAVPALGGVEGDACGLLPVLPCGRMDMRGPVPFGYGAFVSAGMSAAFIWRAF